MRIARTAWLLFAALLAMVGIQWAASFQPPAPEDLPWTRLDLGAPIGAFTGSKLAALGRDPTLCRALLDEAGVAYASAPPRRDGPACGWTAAVRFRSGARPRVVMACPLAAAFEVWMREAVQPAARELLHASVARVDDLGSYACRRIRGGGESTGWSEHAAGDAIDVAGFRLADGRSVSVSRDWRSGARGAFLHRIRDGACRLFSTTLSPDYNAAHRDHLHLDEAARGSFGWRACG